jgi:hypothetical protein
MSLPKWKRCGNTLFWRDLSPKAQVYDNLMFVNPVTFTSVFSAGSGYSERPDFAEPFQDGYMSVVFERLPFFYPSIARKGAPLVVGPSEKLQKAIVWAAESWAAWRDVYREDGLTDREIAKKFLYQLEHEEKSKVLAGIQAAFNGHSDLSEIERAIEEEELRETEAWKQEGEQQPGITPLITMVILVRNGSAAHRMIDLVIEYEGNEDVVFVDSLEEGVWDVLSGLGIGEC